MDNVILSVRNLKTSFFTRRGVIQAVDGLSFDLMRGECLCLIGESGCGKTVAVQSILRIIDIPPGKILNGEAVYRGMDLLKMPESRLRGIRGYKIAMIFQDAQSYLNPILNIGEQIVEQITSHLDIKKEAARERAVELLDQAGIPDARKKMKQYPHQFSGGMKQRVMIAMALSCDPEIIIADEPTTALDVTVKVQILQIFNNLKESKGKSILFITHDFGTVAHIADRVIVMYGGRAVESGDVLTIFNNPKHPYTRGLITCLPDITSKKKKLTSIPGTVPSLMQVTPGCIFEPRCAQAMKICRDEKPLPVKMPDNTIVSCHLYGETDGGK